MTRPGTEGQKVLDGLHNRTYNAVYPLDDMPEWQARHRLRQIQKAYLIHDIVKRNRRQLEFIERDLQKIIAKGTDV